ncbi:ABC transporter permease [Clostridium guangxiense]|uniref:ABC transporter permease n=1 Tax=Clostridium guangxiense TaxID=1662055 RepID=UPI001E4C78B2|nr:ABC transporter permease [Clostridium guangxiense]MCD2347903.1 ABC transporter permease [Clostridium guangxiense]
MDFIIVIFANCKRYLKDNKTIAYMFFIPIFITGFVYFINNKGDEAPNNTAAVINLDKGVYGDKLIKKLKVKRVYKSKTEALNALKSYKYTAIYELPYDFSNSINSKLKPIVNVYKVQDGNINEDFENNLKNSIKESMKINVLEKNNVIKNGKEIKKNILHISYKNISNSIKYDKLFPVINIMYLMFIYSVLFNKDLLELKKDKILKRVSSTASYGYRILASIYISIVIVQSCISILSLSAVNLVFTHSFQNFSMEVLNIILVSMISTSIAIMVSRIFEEYSIGCFIITLMDLLMFSIYLIGSDDKSKYAAAKILMKFTPFYWAVDSIRKFKVFPNAIILILIALAFFTAGSVRDSTFAKSK